MLESLETKGLNLNLLGTKKSKLKEITFKFVKGLNAITGKSLKFREQECILTN